MWGVCIGLKQTHSLQVQLPIHRACHTQEGFIQNVVFKGLGTQHQVPWLSAHMLPTLLGRCWVSSKQTVFRTVMTVRVMDELVGSPTDSGF